MPTFEFKSPEGKTYEVEGPEGATPEQAFQILQQHQKIPAAPPTPPGLIPGEIPPEQAQAAHKQAQAAELAQSPVLGRYKQQGEKLAEFFRTPLGDNLMKLLQGAMPGMSGSLQQISPQAAKTIGKVGEAVAQKLPQQLPSFSIPGTGIVKTAFGSGPKQAAEALQSKFQGVGSQAAERAAQTARAAEEESLQTIPRATGQIQDARIAQTQYADEAAQQAAALQKEREGLSGTVGTPGSAHARGEPLREQVGTRLNQVYEDRSNAAERNFGKVIESGKAKEASGQPFATSQQGQEALRKLKALRGEGSAADPLLAQERVELDKFIAMVEGDPKNGIRPAGVEPLMKQLRIIKDYKEGGPATGTSALPEQFMKQLDSIFEPALYGESGWLPEGGAAQTAYRIASEKLNPFKTAAGKTLTRGEKFDFKQMAASPEEFGNRFFRDSSSVKTLKDMLGNDQMFTSAAKDWAASNIERMNAAQARAWMSKNEGQLSAAGIKGDVEKQVKALADHEQKTALHEAQTAQRTRELARAKEEAKKVPAKIEAGVEAAKAKATAIEERFRTLTTELEKAGPKEVGGKVEAMGKELLKDGHITQEQYGEVLKAAKELAQKHADKVAAKEKLKYIGKVIGIPLAAMTGLSYVPRAGAAEAPQSKRAFSDAEKERKYQEWKRKREAQTQ